MSADTLRSIEPGSGKMLRRAAEEPMSVEVRSANGDTATVTVENVEKGTAYEVDVRGNEPIECSCKAFEFHCDESNDEVCKHCIAVAIRSP